MDIIVSRSFLKYHEIPLDTHVLTRSSPRKTIRMYLASFDIVVSSVLFTDGEGKPIFFISKKLRREVMKYMKHEKNGLGFSTFGENI